MEKNITSQRAWRDLYKKHPLLWINVCFAALIAIVLALYLLHRAMYRDSWKPLISKDVFVGAIIGLLVGWVYAVLREKKFL